MKNKNKGCNKATDKKLIKAHENSEHDSCAEDMHQNDSSSNYDYTGCIWNW